MRVDRDSLPQDEITRHAALREYFCDIDATAAMVDGKWCLDLAWPEGAERHVDLALPIGLKWWRPGLRRSEMSGSYTRDGRVLRCLYDSWTLWSWSQWLSRTPDASNRRIVVLHVDDHRDLGSPRLQIANSEYRDLITDSDVSLDQPDTVSLAIKSGAIGMGSFMTPFLRRLPNVEVRHLCQPPKSSASATWKIDHAVVEDELLRPGASRPVVTLAPSEGSGPGSYLQTPDIDDWLSDTDEATLLLHVDMDYFNNRYDGDSDWAENEKRHDPDRDHVLGEIDRVASALKNRGMVSRLEDIVIAYSPGFFPAELWQEADERLARGMEI